MYLIFLMLYGMVFIPKFRTKNFNRFQTIIGKVLACDMNRLLD